MPVVPLKFRPHQDGLLLFADDAGGYFKSGPAFLHRYACDRLSAHDLEFLNANGHAYNAVDDLAYAGFEHRFAERLYLPREMDYVILVPTLRCNLACGYCQVSRVNEAARGFDWDETTTEAVIGFLDALSARKIKVEFQGGEPLLRLDVITRIRDFCRQRFDASEIVVCTNLQEVSDAAWNLLEQDDVFVSTSLDGNRMTHQKQRTILPGKTDQFFSNLEFASKRLGPQKISALPTIDPHNAPSPQDIIETFLSYDIRSIYLRPVNHQGFARKKFDAKGSADVWNKYHASFIDALVEHNWSSEIPVEEYYFVHCLRRVLRSGHNGHVDLRNPNIVGHSYVVIDYDGKIYPTDEARMVTRIGQFDLSMGDVFCGISADTIDALNAEALNNFHPDCVHCPYQAYCGVELVDDISRYGRIDMPKHMTDFCQRHTSIFDRVFEMIYSDDPKVKKTLALWAGTPHFDPLLARVHQ